MANFFSIHGCWEEKGREGKGENYIKHGKKNPKNASFLFINSKINRGSDCVTVSGSATLILTTVRGIRINIHILLYLH